MLGAGYIAVELAGIFNAFGTDTSLCVRGDRALRRFDDMVSSELKLAMKAQGLKLTEGWTTKEVTIDPGTGKKTVTSTDGRSIDNCDEVLCAIGRHPNTANIGLETCGVELTDKGYVQALFRMFLPMS